LYKNSNIFTQPGVTKNIIKRLVATDTDDSTFIWGNFNTQEDSTTHTHTRLATARKHQHAQSIVQAAVNELSLSYPLRQFQKSYIHVQVHWPHVMFFTFSHTANNSHTGITDGQGLYSLKSLCV
jgi:hypothetical protein